MGRALARVPVEVDINRAEAWREASPCLATMFSLAAVRWQISANTFSGYLWTWSANQVLAAIKLVPLGQSAAQRLLHRLTQDMPAIVERADGLSDHAIAVGTPSQALASAQHELQYTRLYRF